MNPLSFKEFVQVFPGRIDETYQQHSPYGGLSKLFEYDKENDKVKYLNSIFEETYLKDIID